MRVHSKGTPGTGQTSLRALAAAVAIASGALAAGASAQSQVLPLDQIKAGQVGTGRTVFKGDRIEEFGVEVLGVLSHTAPGRNVILARLRGQNLEATGVVQGMSGSPVYIDGKLAGAVAYSFPYAKEPIAGLTPIAEMLAVAEAPPKTSEPGPAALPFTPRLTLEDLLGASAGSASEGPAAGDGRTFRALRVPLIFGGFSAGVLERAGSFFRGLGFQPTTAGGRTQIPLAAPAPDLGLKEGEALALLLVDGDLQVSAVGTVTRVEGNRVLAFGHPLYNLGPVDYGMARASVLTVVPALDASFKMASTGSMIGAITQDRTAGALGEIGRLPRLVPVNVSLSAEGRPAREFKLRIVRDRLLTALLTNMAVSSILGADARSLGDLSLELRGDVFLDNGQSVHLEDLFSGSLGASVTDLSGLVTSVVYFLSNNEFREIGLHRIDLAVRVAEDPRLAFLERVGLDKYEAAPGEIVTLRIAYRTFRGESKSEEIPFRAPRLPAGAEFQLLVGDAASMRAVEATQYRGQTLAPRGLSQLIRLLGSLRKNNRIYLKIVAPRPGLFLRGEEMPNLPPAMKSLFASPRAAATAPVEIVSSTLGEEQIVLPYVFRGSAAVPLRIRS